MSVITHIETICPKIQTKPRSKNAKGSLPVGIELLVLTGNANWYSNEATKYITVNNDRYERKLIAALLMTAPRPNTVCRDTKTALKTDFYHFLWNFTCHSVNKAYAKERKNMFYFIRFLRITEQKLNLPSRLEEKSTREDEKHKRNTVHNALWLDL